MTWAAVLVGAAACYLLKLLGLAVPQAVLDNARVRQVATLLPIALLSALIAVQTVLRRAGPGAGRPGGRARRRGGRGAAAGPVPGRGRRACATTAVIRLLT